MNRSTRILATIMGILTGIGGLGHGIAEIILGDAPAADIGSRIGAFSLIPNYLVTGIAAAAVSVFIIVWTVGFIHRKFGAFVYLLSSIALFLVGGGVAQTLAVIVTWLVATRINQPLSFWRKAIRPEKRKTLAKAWPPVMAAGFGLLLIGVFIWIVFTPPGTIREITYFHYVCWSALAAGFVLIFMSIVFGFARDIYLNEKKETNESELSK